MSDTMIEDGLYAAVIGHADPERPHVARVKKAPTEYEVRVIHAGALGVTYRVDVASVRGIPVTVKATRFNTLVCNTCGTHNRCEHVGAVRAHIAEYGAHEGSLDGRDRAPLPGAA